MLTVPWRTYLNSRRSMCPGAARRIGTRSRDWKLGTPSAQTT
jgi:hypothetical protein